MRKATLLTLVAIVLALPAQAGQHHLGGAAVAGGVVDGAVVDGVDHAGHDVLDAALRRLVKLASARGHCDPGDLACVPPPVADADQHATEVEYNQLNVAHSG